MRKNAWHKLDKGEIKTQHTDTLNGMLHVKFPYTCHQPEWYEHLNDAQVEEAITDVVSCMKTANIQLPRQKFNKSLKPYII